MTMTKLVASVVLAAGAGLVAAQVNLTTFEAGDVIRADEVNGNFRTLADAVEALEARLETTGGTVRVSPVEMMPVDSATDYTRQKTELVLLDASYTDGGLHCFEARVDLPEGAQVAEFAALLKAGSDTTSAAAHLRERAWDEQPWDTLASVVATAADFQEEATTAGLPVAVDPAAHDYAVLTCLQGDGGFLGARVSYTLP